MGLSSFPNSNLQSGETKEPFLALPHNFLLTFPLLRRPGFRSCLHLNTISR